MSFLWSQWSTLGLAGYANSETPCITDPEALLLLSTSIARQDSRLFDEVLDWMRENESWPQSPAPPPLDEENNP